MKHHSRSSPPTRRAKKWPVTIRGALIGGICAILAAVLLVFLSRPGDSDLRVVSVHFAAPDVLRVAVRNVGAKPAVLVRAAVDIDRMWLVPYAMQPLAVLSTSATYRLKLALRPTPYSIDTRISQVVTASTASDPADQFDFLIELASSDHFRDLVASVNGSPQVFSSPRCCNYVFQMRLWLEYDEQPKRAEFGPVIYVAGDVGYYDPAPFRKLPDANLAVLDEVEKWNHGVRGQLDTLKGVKSDRFAVLLERLSF